MLQLQFDPFPVLQTDRLSLRHITSDDADDVFELRSSPQVMRYFDRPMATCAADALALIGKIEAARTANEGVTWGISVLESAKLIGTVGFWRIDNEHDRAEIGYLLHPEFQNQGIMSEALAAALDYGFATIGFHSIEANVNPNNAASIRLLERAGFVREAYFRENYFWNGQFLDSAIYCKLTPHR